jgi:hypothetical protein
VLGSDREEHAGRASDTPVGRWAIARLLLPPLLPLVAVVGGLLALTGLITYAAFAALASTLRWACS